ncbi:hypothetical protein Y032_0102g3429 [Ancylostoma ceylanicum]|nr:hypothetical protein Y032_0102g3429 [Ancylostoma ceylanicum]
MKQGSVATTSFEKKPVITPNTASSSGQTQSNSSDDWRSTLFGEHGILTGLFRMLDQQRKFTAMPDNPSWKINDAKKLDLKQIFDILLKEDDRGNFVDPRSELSEVRLLKRIWLGRGELAEE